MHILAQHISKRYSSGELVLQDLSFELPAGLTLGLLGNNGAGKSTLIHILAGLLKPDFEHPEGRLSLGGLQYDDARSEMDIRANTGLLPEEGLLNPDLSGNEQLDFSALLYGLDPAEENLQMRRNALLSYLFGDEQAANTILKQRCGSYSTGMKKKLGLVLALQHKPDLLLLDEPFSGLDPASSKRVIALLKSYKNELRSLLISSHNLSYVEQVADRIAILDGGKIVYFGSHDELTQNGNEQLETSLFRMIMPAEADTDKLDDLLK